MLFLITALPAQFNDTTNYYMKYMAAGIFNKTRDIRSFIVNNNFSFSMRKKKVDLNSTTGWVYGEQNSALTNNDFSSILNLDLLKNLQRFYYWGLLNYTSSYSLKVDHQFQAGAGIGYTLFNRERLHIVISDGILYETSDLEDKVLGPVSYQTLRNSLRLKYRCGIGAIAVLDGASYWQPSLSSSKDYIVQSSTTLSIRLKKWLSVTSALYYNRFSRTNRENLLVNFGLTAEKYF